MIDYWSNVPRIIWASTLGPLGFLLILLLGYIIFKYTPDSMKTYSTMIMVMTISNAITGLCRVMTARRARRMHDDDVKCARTDTQECTDIKMTANGIEIGSFFKNKEVTTTLKCGEDGSYSNGAVVGITQLACNFMGCAEPTPCSKCNVDALVPQMEPGTSLTYKSFDVQNLCKYYDASCNRDDGKLCRSIEMEYTFADGTTTGVVLVEGVSVTNELRCNLNGEHIYQSKEVTQLSCKFDDCADPTPCTACNFAALTPQPADIGGKLVATESIDRHGCTEAQVICFREDIKVCASVKLIAQCSTGTVQQTVVCRNNIVYPYGEREPVASFSCEFTTCA